MTAIKLSASLVLYHSKPNAIQTIITAFAELPCSKHLYLIDHSENNQLQFLGNSDPCVSYHFMQANNGYGKGHNIAIEWAIAQHSYCHLVLNPDIQFEVSGIMKLLTMMEQAPEIGLLMPQVLYPNGQLQYLCKLLPTPFDLLGRRFLPGILKKIFKKQMDAYECRQLNYSQTMDVPNLSGCFMFMRTEALKKVGVFDPRFFMYLEDTDLCRRIGMHYRTVYYPEVQIVHAYEKGSYKFNKLLFYHIQSAFLYFNKWGWFIDKVRTQKNAATKQLTHS